MDIAEMTITDKIINLVGYELGINNIRVAFNSGLVERLKEGNRSAALDASLASALHLMVAGGKNLVNMNEFPFAYDLLRQSMVTGDYKYAGLAALIIAGPEVMKYIADKSVKFSEKQLIHDTH